MRGAVALLTAPFCASMTRAEGDVGGGFYPSPVVELRMARDCGTDYAWRATAELRPSVHFFVTTRSP
jgi:hypothetical protein